MTRIAANPLTVAAPPAAATLHPKLQAELEPGERILLAGRGADYDLTAAEFFVLVIWAVPLTGIVISNFLSHPTRAPGGLAGGGAILLLLVAFAVFVAWSSAAAYRGSLYALTDRRLLFRKGMLAAPDWWANPVWSLSSRRNECPIGSLRVRGDKARGRIMLRDLAWNSRPSVILTGVDRPLELAAQIKSTLGLDLAIEDYTR